MAADIHALITERNISKAGCLLHSLVPRAQLFCYYNRDKKCVWSSDNADDYEIDSFVADLPNEILQELVASDTTLRRTLASGRTVLAMPVVGENDTVDGVLVALFSKNDGKSSSFNANKLKSILDPAVEMIGESLRVSRDVRKLEKSIAAVEKELAFVYEVDEKNPWCRGASFQPGAVGWSQRTISRHQLQRVVDSLEANSN